MVETRRTSRRLQAKALEQAIKSPSPARSPSTRSSRGRRTPSPRKQQEQEEEQEEPQEIPVLDDDEEEKEETEEKQKVKEEKDVTEEKSKQLEAQQQEAEKETEEEEMMLMEQAEDEDDEEEDEDEDEDEDVDQFAFLAASGLNLSKGGASALSTVKKAAPAPTAESTAAALKRRLVPNELDSGASQLTNFFDLSKSKHTNKATLRAEASAAEEAEIVAKGQRSMAHSARQRAESQRKQSAGRRWFNFESEEMTADAKRDFQLLKMRNYLDPKKFYKSSDHANGLPKHFQMGTVIEGASEFYSARLTKKQRRQTFTDEIMADQGIVDYTRRVATNIQTARSNQGGRKKKRRNY